MTDLEPIRDYKGRIIGAIIPWADDEFEAIRFHTARSMSLGIASCESAARGLFARAQARNRAETERPPPGWLTSRFRRR